MYNGVTSMTCRWPGHFFEEQNMVTWSSEKALTELCGLLAVIHEQHVPQLTVLAPKLLGWYKNYGKWYNQSASEDHRWDFSSLYMSLLRHHVILVCSFYASMRETKRDTDVVLIFLWTVRPITPFNARLNWATCNIFNKTVVLGPETHLALLWTWSGA